MSRRVFDAELGFAASPGHHSPKFKFYFHLHFRFHNLPANHFHLLL
jgi:hypothetical protein